MFANTSFETPETGIDTYPKSAHLGQPQEKWIEYAQLLWHGQMRRRQPRPPARSAQAMDLIDNTAIVFCSDHGDMCGEDTGSGQQIDTLLKASGPGSCPNNGTLSAGIPAWNRR